MKKLPILLSIPHGGVKVPHFLVDRINLTPLELLIDSDTRTKEVFGFSDLVEGYVDIDIARCVVDVNRAYKADSKSVFKDLSHNNKRIWKNTGLSSFEREKLLCNYYHPYHLNISNILSSSNIELAIDAHAMIPQKRAGKQEGRIKRPLFCISNRGSNDPRFPENNITAPFSLMKKLKKNLEDEFSDMLLFDTEDIVKINDPFRGGYITAYHGTDPKVPFIQIEINRALYLPPEQAISLTESTAEKERIKIIRDKLLLVMEKTICA
ncbi:N-formylglutamate amidohydrolase [Clostridia bacterium]|nr:N-formylglutamate amidohydrolase [Clostridia bacterium]